MASGGRDDPTSQMGTPTLHRKVVKPGRSGWNFVHPREPSWRLICRSLMPIETYSPNSLAVVSCNRVNRARYRQDGEKVEIVVSKDTSKRNFCTGVKKTV